MHSRIEIVIFPFYFFYLLLFQFNIFPLPQILPQREFYFLWLRAVSIFILSKHLNINANCNYRVTYIMHIFWNLQSIINPTWKTHTKKIKNKSENLEHWQNSLIDSWRIEKTKQTLTKNVSTISSCTHFSVYPKWLTSHLSPSWVWYGCFQFVYLFYLHQWLKMLNVGVWIWSGLFACLWDVCLFVCFPFQWG